MKTRSVLYALRYFIGVMCVFWITSLVMVLTMGYEGSFLWLNQRFHSSPSDALGWLTTHLADGIILPLLIFLFVWSKDKPLALAGLALILGTGAVTQILKHIFFSGWERPTVIFEGNPLFHLLPENPPRHTSFPSGHATSFAAGGICFAWFFRERHAVFQLLIGIFTVVLCYTRVHLGVHFLGDIAVGSFIGGIFGIWMFARVYPRFTRWLHPMRAEKWERWELTFMFAAALLASLRFVQMAFF